MGVPIEMSPAAGAGIRVMTNWLSELPALTPTN